MSRIYQITNKHSGDVQRYVRANTLNGAVRAYSSELFDAAPITTEEMYQAMKNGFDVLDAIQPEQLDLEGGGKK